LAGRHDVESFIPALIRVHGDSMAGTADDNSRSDLWFLDPDLGRLASRELVFVKEWTRSERMAAKFLRHALTDRTIRWHAEITSEMLDDPTIRAKQPLAPFDPNCFESFVAIRLGLWANRDRPAIDWEASCTCRPADPVRVQSK
jgi:hypothetical protein